MDEFVLNEQNYHSLESNKIWCSKSQFLDFYGVDGCEARAMARINGEFEEPKSDALLVGSYVDCLLTEPEKENEFIAEHPEIISSRGTTKGLLKAEYQRAATMVERVKKDKMMMRALSGEKQVIMTGNIFGLPFKIKMDSYIPHKAIVDLKTVESIHKAYYTANGRVSFVEYFDYILQGAIYQEIVYQNTGERLPFYLACVSKEPIPDIAMIEIDNETLNNRIYGNDLAPDGISKQCEQIRLLKSGELQPIRCESCAFCLPTKKLNETIMYTDLI